MKTTNLKRLDATGGNAGDAEKFLPPSDQESQQFSLDQILFRLDDVTFKKLSALLDTPQNDNPGLKRLMSVKAPWSLD